MTDAGKIVGVLGGMGPDATVDFMAKVIAATPAKSDQDHVHMLVDQNPAVPDRQDAILSNGVDPAPELAAMAKGLEAAGADFLVIPCNSAYVFKDAVVAAATIPLLSIIDVTVAAAREKSPEAVGVLATKGCLQAGVYQEALERVGIKAVLPTDAELGELMELIYSIKSGEYDDNIASRMKSLATALVNRGAQAIIAGCTEIPLVLDDTMLDVPLIASTDVLAKETVAMARGEVPFPY